MSEQGSSVQAAARAESPGAREDRIATLAARVALADDARPVVVVRMDGEAVSATVALVHDGITTSLAVDVSDTLASALHRLLERHRDELDAQARRDVATVLTAPQ